MDFKALQENWNRSGEQDPLWSILTFPGREEGRWNLEEFFGTGHQIVNRVIDIISALQVDLHKSKVLDFGCGVGRLSQAMAKHFKRVVGVDIAPAMIKRAKKYNKAGRRCKYRLNRHNHLRIFKRNEFDFILSLLVLQHMHPFYAKCYIKEFIRILKPGGVCVFQLPCEPVNLSPIEPRIESEPIFQRVKNWINSHFERPHLIKPVMEMHGTPKSEVTKFIENNGGKVLKAIEDRAAGPDLKSFTYFFVKEDCRSDGRFLGWLKDRCKRASVLDPRQFIAHYTLGQTFRFDAAHDSQKYMTSGWDQPEPWGIWTIGKESRLIMILDDLPKADLVLSADVIGFIREAHPSQAINIRANDTAAGQWVFAYKEPERERHLILPRELFGEDAILQLTFEILNPQSPKNLGESKDSRLLGIGLKSLRLAARLEE